MFKKRKPNIVDEAPSQEDRPRKKSSFESAFKIIGVFLLAVFLMITAFNSIYVLQEDEYAVIRTFGATQVVEQPGIKFKIPYLQEMRKVSKAAKQFAVGYDLNSDEAYDNESFMITKDYNFVNVDFYFEYQITDPVKYFYASENPEDIIKNLAQSYIRDTVGIHSVDDVLTTGKYEIQTTVKTLLQNRLEKEDIGITITNAVIQDAEVPTQEVTQAFKNVEDAKQGMETAINNANKDRNEKIPQAEAECDRIIKSAEAEKEARINEAQGQVSRFEQMYEQYSKYPLITKQRMFYETMEELLPDMKVYIVDESGTQKMLPLDSFISGLPASEAGGANQAGGRQDGGAGLENGQGDASHGAGAESGAAAREAAASTGGGQ